MYIAKGMIDECLARWASDSNNNLAAIVTDVFRVNEKGNINVRAIMSLRKHKIQDRQWQQAMEVLGDSTINLLSKGHFRIYERENVESKWEQIPLDFSRITLKEPKKPKES